MKYPDTGICEDCGTESANLTKYRDSWDVSELCPACLNDRQRYNEGQDRESYSDDQDRDSYAI